MLWQIYTRANASAVCHCSHKLHCAFPYLKQSLELRKESSFFLVLLLAAHKHVADSARFNWGTNTAVSHNTATQQKQHRPLLTFRHGHWLVLYVASRARIARQGYHAPSKQVFLGPAHQDAEVADLRRVGVDFAAGAVQNLHSNNKKVWRQQQAHRDMVVTGSELSPESLQ